MTAPLYFILVAGRQAEDVAIELPLSVLGDRDHFLYADYFAVTRAYREERVHRELLEEQRQRESGLRGWLRWPLVRLGLLRAERP